MDNIREPCFGVGADEGRDRERSGQLLLAVVSEDDGQLLGLERRLPHLFERPLDAHALGKAEKVGVHQAAAGRGIEPE